MNLTYTICILIFVSNNYVFGSSNKDSAGEVKGEEQEEPLLATEEQEEPLLETEEQEEPLLENEEQEEPLLKTEAGEDNQLSAGDSNASAGDAGSTITLAGDDTASEFEANESSEGDNEDLATQQHSKVVIYQWRNGIVPYYVDEESYDDLINGRIRRAMDAIQSASCILFKQLSNEKDLAKFGHSFVRVTNPNKERDCVHTLSSGNRGEPVLVLGFDCMQERDIIHALLHVLGFRDEVTHPYRNSYVKIMWENIQPKYRHLFTINNKPTWTHNLAEYDTMSIMHFHDRAFSINGGPTILPLMPNQIINPSDKLSLLDKMKLRLAFENECNRRKVVSLLESCKNYARGDGNVNKGTVTTVDTCNFDKGKSKPLSGGDGHGGANESGIQEGQRPGSSYGIAVLNENSNDKETPLPVADSDKGAVATEDVSSSNNIQDLKRPIYKHMRPKKLL